jgi:site-specific DNA-methyltransferase (adenine-specific)
LERTPDAYVASLVAVFAEVRRVLRDDGTVWLNLGDSYNGKDLTGIPWRVALALQADGWFLRSDVIWSKPNAMPESVTDRPTKAHEHVFLLAKSESYYYDADAIREPHTHPDADLNTGNWAASVRDTGAAFALPAARAANRAVAMSRPRDYIGHALGRNKRSVWTVATMPYAGAHFATMPEALVEPCILAGCPVGGLVCDPFVGSGTVGAVAERLGRRWVGTDLSYQPLATARTAQRGLRW